MPVPAGGLPGCYRQRRASLRSFAGLRDQVLARDAYRCQGCGTKSENAGAGKRLPVHHRRPGVHRPEWLITLCPSCHALIHKLQAHRRWLPSSLIPLWHEQHPGVPEQLQIALENRDETPGTVGQGREATGP